MADLVANGTPVHRVRAAAIEKGMQPLLENALDKARAGITSLEEVLRTVPYRQLGEGLGE
jgi:type II secretory ATPase GspE/PulE/Tfp pilus assembly ATPase PilB-like protein